MSPVEAKTDFSGIKAIFFDAGGTLFQPYPSVGEIYAEVAARHGLRADSRDLEERFHSLWEERDGIRSLAGSSSEKKEREWWHSLVWEVFNGKIDSGGGPRLGGGLRSSTRPGLQAPGGWPSGARSLDDFEAFFEELYDQFAGAGAWRLFPDALPALQELKRRGKILGIVSNWDSRLFGIVEGLGLSGHLDFVLASAVAGAAKPSPKIFEEALKRARVSSSEALHVGDSLEDDIRGAEGAGIRAALLDRKGRRQGHHLIISSLQFLCGMFEN